MNPPASPPPPGGPPKGLLVGAGLAVLLLVALGAFFLGRGTSGGTSPVAPSATPFAPAEAVSSNKGALLQALPPTSGPTEMRVPTEAVRPAFWVDVHSPGKVREALAQNVWVREQIQKPLGKGFVGGWAAFFGTSAEDLGGSFKGAVFDVVAGQLLVAPFRVVWFSGESRAGTPAILVPDPGNAALAAFESLGGVVRRSVMTADSCPGGEGEVPEGGFSVQRWLVAEQGLWVGRTEDRLVFARHPAVVLQGLCEPDLELEAPRGVDVEVGFAPEPLGRELQLLSHVVGLGTGTRLRFGVEGHRLVGRGITGPLVGEDSRLDSAPLSEELLKLIPEETPVLLALQLKLPERLDRDTLKAFWSDKGSELPTRTRQVALLWTPRGDERLPTEVALLWGQPEDGEALGRIFSGPNYMVSGELCAHHVMASTPDVFAKLRKACEGQGPNMLNAAAPVVQGLREPGSVAFGVHTGRLLGTLLADGYESQVYPRKARAGAAPPEVEEARRDMETLPYLGLRGTVRGDTLVPGGFGS